MQMSSEVDESVRRYHANAEYFTAEQCHIVEMSNDPRDPTASIARARVEPGVTTRWHRLVDTIERYVVIEGDALVEVGDTRPQRIGPGDVVVIPSMVAQRITNTGTRDFVFLAICTPRFSFDHYVDIEDER
jgi:mannose-6-phosphate isomerase-like protein (cupin superfamily)